MSHRSGAVTIYYVVYVVLLVLLSMTVEASRHDLRHLNFAVALLIAAVKAICIAWFFMHVRQGTPLVKLVVAASLIWLAIMFSLSLADYWTRDWDSMINRSHGAAESSKENAE